MILSTRAKYFTESVIREMTRLSDEYNAINLSQGFPDFPASDHIKQLACKYIMDDFNQYPITFGEIKLRNAIAKKYEESYGLHYAPDENITVCCGATEAMISSLIAILNTEDEVVVFEPFYENYWADAVISGAKLQFITLYKPDWHFNETELRRAFNSNTKAIIINTPNNPTGKVFSLEELSLISELCQEYDSIAVTDEVYEHIIYDNLKHMPIASLEGMKDRTIIISSFSKTFSVTGWRVGYALASKEITDNIKKFHDFLTVGAPTPFQLALAEAMSNMKVYYDELSINYAKKREILLKGLNDIGFKFHQVKGAYYVMGDFSDITQGMSDYEFAQMLIKDKGVASVPGTSFYSMNKQEGSYTVRFCFCKKDETLREAIRRLNSLK
jgi:aspartate/methionine/tyrosine aminotransferase